jgi:S1-C subfamily serine protease
MGIVGVTPDGPAAAAGLQADEVITSVNDTPVRRTTVTTPQGATRTVKVTLGQLPGS